MANTIFKIRRSSVPGKVPNTSQISIGELAINLNDRKLFSTDGTSVFELGSNLTNQFVYSTVVVGNSTVNSTINSTSFSGTANNTTYAFGKTEGNLNVNSAVTSNTTTYINANTGIISNATGVFVNSAYIATLTANNSSYLGGVAASGYANTTSPLITTSVTVGNSTVNSTINSTSFSGTSNLATYIVANTGIISNATGVYVNSSYIATLTANNSNYLGGIAASGYANTTSPLITTSISVGNTSSNVTTTSTSIKLSDGSSIGTFNSLGTRNRIINGDMRINQRGYTSSSPLTTNGFCVDRFYVNILTAGGFSSYQSTTNYPVGFNNSLFFTKTTGNTPSSTDYNIIYQGIEGLNIADLLWGTANAKTVTLSFWVYSGATGTFSGSLRNGIVGSYYSYPFTYTISSSNTWTYVTITVPGATVGTWSTDNSGGITLFFDLGSGSTLRSTANSWQSGNFIGVTGSSTYPTSTTGGTFYITGVQLEVGSIATPFERRLYGQELVLCQRYYQTASSTSANTFSINDGNSLGMIHPTSTLRMGYKYPVTMRTSPTLTIYDSSGNSSKLTYYTNTNGWNTNGAITFGVATTATGFYLGHNIASATETQFLFTASAELS